MNPNGQNQWWSKWEFTITEHGRHVPRADVLANMARWLRAGFGSVGKLRLIRTLTGWRIEAVIEGKPAHDPDYVRHVGAQFQTNFVDKGWGPIAATGAVSARLIAGSPQDGRPSEQWIEMPFIALR